MSPVLFRLIQLGLVLLVTAFPVYAKVLVTSELSFIQLLISVSSEVLMMSMALCAAAMLDGAEVLMQKKSRLMGFVDIYMLICLAGIAVSSILLLIHAQNDTSAEQLWGQAFYLMSATNVLNSAALTLSATLRRRG